MEFRLIYEGPLRGQGAKSTHKWEIRRALHPQLQRLWQLRPLETLADSLLAYPPRPDKVSVIVEKGGLHFAPLVTQRLNLYVELSVLLFRQQPRGTLITDGGDIDNRLKTLLDGLRVPHGSLEGRKTLPDEPDPDPMFCLLEDDSLVTKVSVESEQLLRPARPDEVVAIISVHVKKTVLTHSNMSL
ncbi:hypothetical protein [Azohydromonas sp.]|uniref:hypothetical protein n=1 Tax=Azohydromonas sp. TaxID=1872666 RepID=UPI002B64E000|nr:hypothetical protein [Azohydromonas sp.]HMM86616.1 hypothetical protein [Azohydromonas sp.]